MNISGAGKVVMTESDGSQVEYEPRIMEFKSPSEHCFDKVRYDVELQILLAKPGEDFFSAGLSVFWDQSANNEKASSCPFI